MDSVLIINTCGILTLEKLSWAWRDLLLRDGPLKWPEEGWGGGGGCAKFSIFGATCSPFAWDVFLFALIRQARIWKMFWVEKLEKINWNQERMICGKSLETCCVNFFFAWADILSEKNPYFGKHLFCKTRTDYAYKLLTGAPNENIVQNHLNIALLNVFWHLNGRYRNTFIP